MDPEPCGVEAAAIGAAEPGYNRVEVVADKDIAMEGGSAEKAMGVEDEGSTTPVPDRVLAIYLSFWLSLFIHWVAINLAKIGSVLACVN